MTAAKRKVPVQVYLPPYFKDEHGMCPPLSDEAKRKLEETTYDPLEKEERRCAFLSIFKYNNYSNEKFMKITLPIYASFHFKKNRI